MMTYVHSFLTSLCIANVPPQRSRRGECLSPGCVPVFGSPLPGNKSLHCVVFAVCRAATLEYVAGCASFTQTLLLWPGNAGDSFSSFCRSLVLKCNVTPPSFQPCETVCVTARRIHKTNQHNGRIIPRNREAHTIGWTVFVYVFFFVEKIFSFP